MVENGTLDVGINIVKLSVEAVAGEHGAWNTDISVKREKAPELKLKSLLAFGKPVENNSITVENIVTKIEAKDIKATFDYGNEKDKPIPIMIKNETLNEGMNIVKLSVEAVAGEHGAWNTDISVKREKAPELKLKSLLAFGKPVENNPITVENIITKIEAKDIKATFDYGNEKDKPIPVMIKNETLNEGMNTVKLSVEAVAGEHGAWNTDISVKRMYYVLKPSHLIHKIDKNGSKVNMMHGSCTVYNAVSEFTSKDVLAFFRCKGETTSSTHFNVIVENGKLNIGKNIVKLSVPEVAGEHEAWNMDLTVIRNALPDNSLVPVTPPQEGIVGSAPNKKFISCIDEWEHDSPIEDFQGVFVEGRTVILSPFNIAETETTYKLWKEIYDWATDASRGANKYTFANPGSMGYVWHTPTKLPPFSGEVSELEPVTFISWYDCIVWCNAYTEKKYGSDSECVYRTDDNDNTVLRDATELIKYYIEPYFDKTKKGFRLPTEAEWEYVARVQSDGSLCPSSYSSGAVGNWMDEDSYDVMEFVRYATISGYHKTSKVKCRAANALGVYDMSGNVSEFCWDSRPTGATVPTGTVTNPALRNGGLVIRGGAFNSRLAFLLVGARKT